MSEEKITLSLEELRKVIRKMILEELSKMMRAGIARTYGPVEHK